MSLLPFGIYITIFHMKGNLSPTNKVYIIQISIYQFSQVQSKIRRRQWHPTPVLLPGKSHGQGSMVGCSPWVTKSLTWLSDCTFTFHFHALEKAMATHSSVLAWRVPGTGEPGGLPSMGLHRVGHDWSDLAKKSKIICWLDLFFLISWSCYISCNIRQVNLNASALNTIY